MKFALLGTDPESLSLATVAVQLGHQIVWCGDLGAPGGNHAPWVSLEDEGDQWEALLDRAACSAVIAGRGSASAELRAERLNQLVKNGIAVLTTFPLVDSVLAFYEIDMSRCESRAVLHHFNPLVQQQPIVEQCATWVRQGHPELGSVEQIVWDRPLENRTREEVLWHFARDVELLQRVAGRLSRLGALGSPDEEATYSGLSVQLMGELKRPVRWAVGPVERAAWPRLTLIAQRGRVTVDFDESGRSRQMETNIAGEANTNTLDSSHDTSLAISRFVKAVETGDSASSTWPEALQAMELTDTIEISLRRGRMIDVHPQQLTEKLAFRGAMSAVGCGVLLVLPPVLVALGWMAELMGLPLADYWPHGLLALLVVFLAFQFLPKLLVPPSAVDASTEEDQKHNELAD